VIGPSGDRVKWDPSAGVFDMNEESVEPGAFARVFVEVRDSDFGIV